MAKLKDLVNVNIGRDVINIQGQAIPIIFTMESFPYVEEAYGKEYTEFERDLNGMMTRANEGEISIGTNEIKLMSALIYGMVRAGGTECTPLELKSSIPLNDLPGVFEKVFGIFTNQTFQPSDAQTLSAVEAVAAKKKKQRPKKRKK